MMSWKQYSIFIFIVSATGAPAEDPIRIDLPIYNQPESQSSFNIAKPLEVENQPGGEPISDKSIINNLITNKFDKIAKLGTGPFATITKLEYAIEETEGYGSKTLSAKENLGKAAADIFQPKPIVDTIREEDKYGNTGDKFYSTGRALVAGSSKIAMFVNSLLEIPGSIIRQLSRVTTEKLNNLGAKVVGL